MSEPGAAIEVTEHTVDLPVKTGFSIVQITDLHRGCGGTDKLLSAAMEKASALEADYAVITGDFTDGPAHDIDAVIEFSSALKAKRGVYACYGNHDHRGDAARIAKGLEQINVRLLVNESQALHDDDVWIAAVDDMHEGNPDFEKTLANVPPNAPLILLSHNPNAITAIEHTRPTLILSGHTHGGQIVLPFPSPEFVCWHHLQTRFVAGWFERGPAKLYVNRGIGVTGSWPLCRRFRCPPEISLFRIRPSAG